MILDVGGKIFKTSRDTLLSVPGSLLYKIFEDENTDELKQPDGSVFIDRPHTHFMYILNYLRDPNEKLVIPSKKH